MAAARHAGAHPLESAWYSRGWLARALLPLSWLFAALTGVRRSLYRRGVLHAESLPAPVVVVGNLIVGGAGKTPTVMAVADLLRANGFHPGVISRGYGRRNDGLAEVHPDSDATAMGDEPLLLRIRLDMPVVVARDRVAAARALMQRHAQVDVIVSDDGLQHLRLPRSVQVLVFDERGGGNGWLLPAGPLREALPCHVPAHTLVLYNAARPSTALPGSLVKRSLSGAVSLSDWWAGAAPSHDALQRLRGRPVLAAAGTAQPSRFFRMLEEAGLAITPLPLPDHHDFLALPWPRGTPEVLVTEKDAVKLRPDRVGSTQVWVVPLDFRLDAAFEQELLGMLPPPSTRTPHGHPTA